MYKEVLVINFNFYKITNGGVSYRKRIKKSKKQLTNKYKKQKY